MDRETSPEVAVVGGGVIGLSLAWQLARKGRLVTVFDQGEAGKGASWVSAGMLAPLSEVGFEEEDFLRLGLESLHLYEKFLAEIEEDTGLSITIDPRGCLIVAFNRDEAEMIRRLYRFRERLDLPVTWLTGSEAREIEPLLSPKATAAMWIEQDKQIDNRALVSALKRAFIERGGRLKEGTKVERISTEGDAVRGVELEGSGLVRCPVVIVAAGAWSRRIGGIPEEILPPVRPVKGQIVSLRATAEFPLAHIVRGPDAYILPKPDGRVLVGASEEEMGFDPSPTAGPVMRLLQRGWEVIPAIYDLPIESIDVGLRPGSRDHQPILGRTKLEGLYYATGHYRHGVLLAPATAYCVADLICGGKTHELCRPFQAMRHIST